MTDPGKLMPDGSTVVDEDIAAAVSAATDPAPDGSHLFYLPWRGTIAWEGRETIDGRRVELGALTWDGTPLPIFANATEHDLTSVIGSVDKIARDEETGRITACGWISGHEPGTVLPCGIMVHRFVIEDSVQPITFADGQLLSVAAWPGYTPAWRDTHITVGHRP